MVVMEQPLKNVYPEIDVVTTPDGKPVAMVHVNNFTSEINAWSNLFFELLQSMGATIGKGELFDFLFKILCFVKIFIKIFYCFYHNNYA